jgi:hypothetical protein
VFEGADPMTGKKQYRTKAFRGTKRQAQNELALLVSHVNGGVLQTRNCSVAELIDAWLAHIDNVGRSPSTLYNYGRLVRQLPEPFKALPLSKVTPKIVDDLYRFLARDTGRKPATISGLQATHRHDVHRTTEQYRGRASLAPPPAEVSPVIQWGPHERGVDQGPAESRRGGG